MLRISLLKVENPSCLWGRVIRGPDGDAESPEHYSKLHLQMNLFYREPTLDVHRLKPTPLEEGQVCVVYWAAMKSWCRAVVESVIMDSVCCQARCLLVDHGERIVVPSEQIRVAMENFLQLPFWVRRFHLAGIKPTTLRVSVFEEKAELRPSAQWDSSATLYLHSLLRASTHTEAVLLESESDSTALELYLTAGDIKICVNDDLVVKKFAYYSTKSGGLEDWDRLPAMLSSSILTQTVSNKPTAQTQPPPDQQSPPAGAGDWLTAPSQPQTEQHKPVNLEGDCWSKLTEQQLFSSSQSKSGSDTSAAAESDSSEDMGSSLAASLTEKLHLFRFLKFLNPGSSYEPAAPSDEEALLLMSGKTGAEKLQSSQAEYLADEEGSGSSRSVESAQADEPPRSEEDRACSRFLEWLNPDSLNPDPDPEDAVVSPTAPRTSGILVHSAFPVEPWSSLDDAPIADPLRWVLRQKQYRALTQADCYSWPAVARGCNTIIISNSADQPLSYLSPLLTHILLNSVFTSHTSSSGPIAVLLCLGWEKVQAVYDLLEARKVSQNLHPTTVLLGVGKDEAKSVKIPKNCLLLISTPFSLVRLLSCHCFLFLRLYHLVLDEADQLFTHAPDEMETILQHFQKVTSSEENASCPQQLVAVAKRWTSHMEGLLSSYMPYPSVVITVPEEAALYGNVQQIIVMTLESNKISGLLGTLALNSDVTQKTLIIVNSIQEVEDVFKAVSSRSVFCLKIQEGLTHEIDFVIQQWEKDIDPGTHVILVTTNDCLKSLGIRDATCVIHYSFPSSPKLFGIRLFCMVENFRNLSTRNPTQSCHQVTRSVLLISEKNARHVNEVLRYLRRTNALLPPDLLTFAQGVRVAREGQKMDRPLCSYLKSFGVCRDNSICPERHRFISHLDQSELPASGAIEVVPLYIKTASVFYGRIIRKEDGSFEKMASEMASYYADKKPGAKELLEGGLYAVQEDDVFHRVKILSVPDRNNRLFISLLVRFIDVGKEEEVKSHQILQLPEQFHALPGQAVEIIVCRVKPVDSESSWHPKVTRAISKKIRGLQHRARAVLSLGNTVFVDPMVRVTQVPGMKTVINEYNVQTEILNTGMGMSNPEHLDLLRELCEEGSSCEDTNHASWPGDSWPSVKVRIKAEDGVLVNTFRVAEVRKLKAPDLPHLEPMSPPSGNQSLVPTPKVHLGLVCGQNSQLESEADFGQRNTVKKPAEQMESTTDGEVCPSTSSTAAVNQGEKGVQEGADQSSRQQVISTSGTDCDNAARSFHPLIRWCQTSDSVIITMKLMNPENQCCDFYADRVVYSGRVNGRSYRADLELHQKIAADVCSWEMKSNEPVLRLVKQQPGAWEKLLRNKNIFVSYDMGDFEDEDEASNGQWFLEDTVEEEKCFLDSKSSSKSDN
ncbi:putative ATP-dependent RNA helicase TDRD12 isoform X2 [Archocentrus centrarchus]|uniref:putative ATP-dependent RNA helicase TDRD12 isoform X2 n=1 Tax=Archocentrus centrarchus TaxID=63155 RepID=UPI0011E9FE81|nr:putative ATP-dependent RNA helicase TDRD12 isoform X2 [Archocentrus centrarchus]